MYGLGFVVRRSSGWLVDARGHRHSSPPFYRLSNKRVQFKAATRCYHTSRYPLSTGTFRACLPSLTPSQPNVLYVSLSPAHLLTPLHRALHSCWSRVQRRGILGFMSLFALTRGGRQHQVSRGWLVGLWLGGRPLFDNAVCWWREEGKEG